MVGGWWKRDTKEWEAGEGKREKGIWSERQIAVTKAEVVCVCVRVRVRGNEKGAIEAERKKKQLADN